jgi:hypothetical protein
MKHILIYTLCRKNAVFILNCGDVRSNNWSLMSLLKYRIFALQENNYYFRVASKYKFLQTRSAIC